MLSNYNVNIFFLNFSDQDSLEKDSLTSSTDLGMRRSISMTSIGDMDKEPVGELKLL